MIQESIPITFIHNKNICPYYDILQMFPKRFMEFIRETSSILEATYITKQHIMYCLSNIFFYMTCPMGIGYIRFK